MAIKKDKPLLGGEIARNSKRFNNRSETHERAKKSAITGKKSLPLKRPKKIVKLSSKVVNYALCVPTSIIDNCSNLEQITHAVYQIAKSATIFGVSEIVILDLGEQKDTNAAESHKKDTKKVRTQVKIKFDQPAEPAKDKPTPAKVVQKKKLSPAMLIASLLQYFVTPPYLVNSVFKKSFLECFQIASKLPRLTALPFMRYIKDDRGRYREGLAIRMQKPGSSNGNSKKKPYEQTKYINVGKGENLELRGQLVPVNVRVTVDMIEKKVVSPEEAYGEFVGAQTSFGYHVRVAKTFADVFTGCASPQGYTQTVWVNSGDYYYNPDLKKSIKVDSKIPHIEKIIKPSLSEDGEDDIGSPANLLVVFGKWDHISNSFKQSKDQFERCEGAYQFFDGQLDLPGASPHGYICVEDGCMIALATLANY